MDFTVMEGFTSKEMDQFKSICNYLLGHTFVVRTIYKPDVGRVNNPDYTFLSIHRDTVREFLSLLDWDLRHDDYNGYYYVLNTDEVNRLTLNKNATAITLALRMIFEENMERAGLEHDVICTVRDVLEKIVTDYAILSSRPNMDEVRQGLTMLENHNVIQRLEGKFSQAGCRLAILPTILTAVSSERLEAVVSALRKEEDIEEADEDIVD
ncbi:MAG: DUF4194 domain-containing protein [Peptococcaceae bacterium]|jgi:hypothetical protein|nr:DUF4194 domain-containing protein [Peptococcaceae bacterium]